MPAHPSSQGKATDRADDPSDRIGDRQQQQPTAGIGPGSFPGTSCFSSSDARVADGYRSGVTHCHEEEDPPWTGAWTGTRGNPSAVCAFLALT